MQTSQSNKAQGELKHHYDKKTKNCQFKVGDKVLVLLPNEHNKLTLKWRSLYMVKEFINRMDCKVKVKGKIKISHSNLLKQYFERDSWCGSVG